MAMCRCSQRTAAITCARGWSSSGHESDVDQPRSASLDTADKWPRWPDTWWQLRTARGHLEVRVTGNRGKARVSRECNVCVDRTRIYEQTVNTFVTRLRANLERYERDGVTGTFTRYARSWRERSVTYGISWHFISLYQERHRTVLASHYDHGIHGIWTATCPRIHDIQSPYY